MFSLSLSLSLFLPVVFCSLRQEELSHYAVPLQWVRFSYPLRSQSGKAFKLNLNHVWSYYSWANNVAPAQEWGLGGITLLTSKRAGTEELCITQRSPLSNYKLVVALHSQVVHWAFWDYAAECGSTSIKIAQSGPSCRNCPQMFYICGAICRHNTVSKECRSWQNTVFLWHCYFEWQPSYQFYFLHILKQCMCLCSSLSVTSIQIYSESFWESGSSDVA